MDQGKAENRDMIRGHLLKQEYTHTHTLSLLVKAGWISYATTLWSYIGRSSGIICDVVSLERNSSCK